MNEENKPSPGRLLRSQFRVVADAVCRPGATKDSGATKKEANKDVDKESRPRYCTLGLSQNCT